MIRQAVVLCIAVGAPILWALLIADPSPAGSAPPPIVLPNYRPLFFCELGGLALTHELSRFGFVRRASNPILAAAVFGVLSTLCYIPVLEIDDVPGYTWLIASEVAASVAMLFAAKSKNFQRVSVAIIMLAQAALSIGVSLDDQPRPFSGPVTAPNVHGMDTWGRLYPDSVREEVNIYSEKGATRWHVIYKTHASPAAVVAFYDDLAAQNGFSERATFLSFHDYKRPGTHDRFSCMMSHYGGGLMIVYEAEAKVGAP